jgi:hypothetical protein
MKRTFLEIGLILLLATNTVLVLTGIGHIAECRSVSLSKK